MTHFLSFFLQGGIKLHEKLRCGRTDFLSSQEDAHKLFSVHLFTVTCDPVLLLSYRDFTFHRNQMQGRMAGQDVLVCLLFRIEMKEELDKWISEIATTLSRAPVSSNSVVKSNTPARKHPFSFVGMFTSASNFLQKQVKVEGAGRLRSCGEKIKMSGNSI